MSDYLPDRLLLLNGPQQGMALRLDQGAVTIASADEVGVLRSCSLLLDQEDFGGVCVLFYRQNQGDRFVVEVFSVGKNTACVIVNERAHIRQAKLHAGDQIWVGDVARTRSGELEPLRLRVLAGEQG
jgi:hypothetical protein